MASVRKFQAQAKPYCKTNKVWLPDRVRRSGRAQRRKALVALGDGVGWLSRLAMAGDTLGFYTLHLKALELEHLEHESNLYDHAAVHAIKQAIHQAMPGVFWARLEVGKQGRRLHVHVLAHNAPRVAHHAREVDSLKKLAEYVCKCPVPSDAKSGDVLDTAKRLARLEGKKRLPKTCFSRGIPKP
jgi:hypothetical protein